MAGSSPKAPDQPLLLEFANGGTLRGIPDGNGGMVVRLETAEERADSIKAIQGRKEAEAREFELGLNEVKNTIMGTSSVEEAVAAAEQEISPTTTTAASEVSVEAHNEYMRQQEELDRLYLGTPLSREMDKLRRSQEEDAAYAEAEAEVEQEVDRERTEIAADAAVENAGVETEDQEAAARANAINEELKKFANLEPGETLDEGERRETKGKLAKMTVAVLKETAKASGISQQGTKAELVNRLVSVLESVNLVKKYGSLEAFENAVSTGAVPEEAMERFEAAGLGSPEAIYNRGQEGGAFNLPREAPDSLAGIDLKGVELTRDLTNDAGEVTRTVTVSAETAIRREDKRIDVIKKLAGCLLR